MEALIISGQALLLIAAIVTINHHRHQIRDFEWEDDKMARKYGRLVEKAANLSHENSMYRVNEKLLRNQLKSLLNGDAFEEEDEWPEAEEEEDVHKDWKAKRDEIQGDVDREIEEGNCHWSSELLEKVVVFQAMSKKPETNQQAFEKYYKKWKAEQEAVKIYSTITKGKK